MEVISNSTKPFFKKNKKYKVISLFSGAGGLDLGFKKAGYSIIGTAEKMKEAVETHNFNFGLKSSPIDLSNKEKYKNFIQKFSDEKIDLLIGGFPCQGYSMAGKRDPNDKRNMLYKKVVSVLRDLKIKKFVLENVVGILSMNKGNEIKKIENYFNENGFYFKYTILDSSNFKVPQKRKRVIFIGTSKKNEINSIKRTLEKLKNYKSNIVTVKESIEDLENIEEDKSFNHIFANHSKEMIKRIKNVKIGKSLYKNYSDGWRKIDYLKPSPTVKENHGGVHLHPIKNRTLTPRELARLQSFPDNFIFKGSKKMQLVQIGNAVPVNFARIIAQNIAKIM